MTASPTGIDNLRAMFARADSHDYLEGQLAYARYNTVMCQLSRRFSISLERVIAVFVSLSPNSDYHGNLRSTVSVLAAVHHGVDRTKVVVSTYNHCRDRAFDYAVGARDFLAETKGPKIINFYHNVLDPKDTRWVTIDGHMSAIWFGENMTMREALVTMSEYREIAAATKKLAFENFMLPNQMQAILWFTRKRVARVRFDPQGGLFDWADGDLWKTNVDTDAMKPYGA